MYTQQARVEYEQLLQASKESKGAIPTPGRPPLCVVVIPGNITSIRLIEHLAANTEKHCPAVLIESEIDTLTQASRGEHGGFSDILRQSFHNEPVKVSRKQDDRYIEIELPQLAAALSGTVGQVINMIKSSEDGLFTRFLVHYLEKPSEWRDVTPCEGCYSHADFFERQADQWWDFWQFTKDKPLEVKLSDDQWATLNYYFTEEHADAIEAGNVHCLGIVTRHGVMLFKLAMTLTTLRRWQDNSEEVVRICTDDDFNMAWSLVAESLLHSQKLYAKLPHAPVSGSGGKKIRFYNALPNLPATFRTSTAILTAEGVGISERSAQRHLQDFVRVGKLEQIDHGHYRKKAGGVNSGMAY